jgi:hypothetical protein
MPVLLNIFPVLVTSCPRLCFARPGPAGDIRVLATVLGCLSVQSFHLAGDVLDHLGHLHHGLHLLAGVEGEEVEELLQAGLGVLQVRVD